MAWLSFGCVLRLVPARPLISVPSSRSSCQRRRVRRLWGVAAAVAQALLGQADHDWACRLRRRLDRQGGRWWHSRMPKS